MNKIVDIVMATYNGEKYISEQIESIINQTYKSWRLLVTDDGSSDSTMDFLNDFALKDSRIVIVNKVRQGGVIQNFNKGLSFSSSDYILLSDQDDVWFPNKIENLLKFIQKKESQYSEKTPLLVFSDRKIVDDKLKVLSESAFESQDFPPELNCLEDFLMWRSTIFGCTVIFNRSLFEIATPIPKGVPMHDQWLGLLASSKGEVLLYDDVTIFYRIHDNNVVGGQKKTFIGKLIQTKSLYRKIVGAVNSTKSQYEIFYKLENKNTSLHFSERVMYLKKHVCPFFKYSIVYSVVYSFVFLFLRRIIK